MNAVVYPQPICAAVTLSGRFYWECQMPEGHTGNHYYSADPYIDLTVDRPLDVRAHAH
jgi:hypothetical protein